MWYHRDIEKENEREAREAPRARSCDRSFFPLSLFDPSARRCPSLSACDLSLPLFLPFCFATFPSRMEQILGQPDSCSFLACRWVTFTDTFSSLFFPPFRDATHAYMTHHRRKPNHSGMLARFAAEEKEVRGYHPFPSRPPSCPVARVHFSIFLSASLSTFCPSAFLSFCFFPLVLRCSVSLLFVVLYSCFFCVLFLCIAFCVFMSCVISVFLSLCSVFATFFRVDSISVLLLSCCSFSSWSRCVT